MSKIKTLGIAALLALPMSIAIAGPMRHHENLLKAQEALNNAFDHITASQRANEWDEGHHAEKAKGLIEQAKEEVRLSAEYDNHR